MAYRVELGTPGQKLGSCIWVVVHAAVVAIGVREHVAEDDTGGNDGS